MSELQLVIRDHQQAIHGTCHSSFADRVVAALSAEPVPIDELDTALARFIQPGEGSFFRRFQTGCHAEPHDAGLMVVDLAARLVLCDSTYSRPERWGP
jgi:hypothetical protein